MSPKAFNQLKNLSEEENNIINSIDTKEIQTKLINHHLGNYEQPKFHYACPLGFMKVYLGEEGHEIMALVYTGSELNIIPEDSAIKAGLTTRFLNMNLSYIEPDGRRLCLPVCSPQKKGWREEPPAGRGTCAVSQLEYWKELPKENESSPQSQANFGENSHQVLDSVEVKDSKYKVKIHEELAPINTEDFNLKLKEEKSPKPLASKKENGNTCSQISQAIKSYNCKNTEDIKIKTLTKLISTIKALKSVSKGIFKNNWKLSIKPVVTIFPSNIKISKKKDITTQNHLKLQEENIDVIPKSEEYASVNEILNDTIENSHHNKNTYPQEISISNEGESKTTYKHNFHQRATHKKKFSNLENPQISFPSNLENIDPRILMEGISGENKSYPNIEHVGPRLTREELDLTRIIKNPIGQNDQNQVKYIPFCIEEEPLKMEFPCFNSSRKYIECSFSTVHNINEANIDESTYENSIDSLSQLTIKKELNQQKTLHTQAKLSGEAYNNCHIKKN
ncbi:hypothetical protein O181_106091 [Austropuccinia psidii MF-1]|uniref:Uncharacterized protein n=1 Tax=Austropuccinia psidii MF-1 TaxID=1389203 RepID=A0A9Q3PMX5_9BASI|nr:hypothetical protein [Austropuccinia psidii MF-1]